MHSFFDDVYPAVEKFEYGAYCSASEKNEIDTPMHTHNKGQFIYAQKGTLHIITEHHQYFLPVEHFIWIPQNTRHRVWTNNTHIMMFTIYFDTQHQQNDFYDETGVYVVNNLLHEMITFATQWHGHIDRHMPVAYPFLQALKAILPTLRTVAKLPLLGFVQAKNERLLKVMDYMRENINHKISLSLVAEKFGFSPRSLSRLFSVEGISFNAYLQSVRIVKSMELLAEKNMDVNTVSIFVGYESPASFSKVFKKFTGMLPSDYLKSPHKNLPRKE